MNSTDPSYPLFSILSFLSFILSLVPLRWQLKAWNAGTCAFIFWNSVASLFLFINSVLWTGNTSDTIPVYCDIASKYLIGAPIGMASSCLCITRRLYKITRISDLGATDRIDKISAVYYDLSVAVGIPVLVMVLHYIVQPHRYDILEDVGCYAVVYNTLPSYFLVFHWPVTLGTICVYHSAMTIWSIRKRHIQMNRLTTFNDTLLMKKYAKLVAFAATNMILIVPLGIFSIYLSANKVEFTPWVSWSATHHAFSHVDLVPAAVWRNGNNNTRILVELTRWIFPVSSIIFFAFFGFTSEAWKQYERIGNGVKKCWRWVFSASASTRPSTSSAVPGATALDIPLKIRGDDGSSVLTGSIKVGTEVV